MRPEAWSDEDGDMYVSGTHDPVVAQEVFRKFFAEDTDFPEEVDFSEGNAMWWDPVVFSEEYEWIGPEFTSSTPVEGWIPVLRVSQY